MSTFTRRREEFDLFGLWKQFGQGGTSTDNRLYISWFGIPMIPTICAASVCFVLTFIVHT